MDCGGVGSPAGSSNLFGEIVMVIQYTTDVHCDFCPDYVSGPVGTQPQQARARVIAKDIGWKRLRGKNKWMIDICPKCQKEGKE